MSGEENVSEKDAEKEEDSLDVSVREITKQEKDILSIKRKTSTVCHSGNSHVWKVDGEICSVFSSLQVKIIAFGSDHCLALTEDQKLYAYGSNTHGQLGQGDCEERKDLCLVEGFGDSPIHHISCGERHNAVLDEAGILYTWGDSTHGQCGLGEVGIFQIPTIVDFLPTRNVSLKRGTSPKIDQHFKTIIKDIDCGEVFSVAIDTKGCVWSWGSGSALGHGNDYEIISVPKLIKSLSNRKAIFLACGAYHCIVITQDEFVDDMLNIPSSPDYRTTSVSSSYYSELKQKNPSTASKVPFEQNKMLTAESSSPITEMKHSQSVTDLKKDDEEDQKSPGMFIASLLNCVGAWVFFYKELRLFLSKRKKVYNYMYIYLY